MGITNNLFQMNFSDEWKETTVFTFEGPHDDGIQHNLALVVDPFIPKGMTLQEYAQREIAGPKRVMPGFELVSDKEKQFSGGATAWEIVYKYVPAENVVLFQKQIFLLNGGNAYIFTATFTKKTLATLGVDIDRIISSFRALKPAAYEDSEE